MEYDSDNSPPSSDDPNSASSDSECDLHSLLSSDSLFGSSDSDTDGGVWINIWHDVYY